MRKATRPPRRPGGGLNNELATIAAELDRVQRLFEVASSSARIGSWEIELPSRRMTWSREIYRIHGTHPNQEVSLEAMLRLYPSDERTRLNAALEESISSGGCFEVEAPLITADGQVRWMRITSQGHSENHATKRLVGTVQDITEDRQRLRKLERLACHDDLTGLPNRKLFREDLDQAISKAKAEGTEVGLMLIDLDDFKTVNDTFGHDHGDQMLKEFARRLKLCFRAGDTLARLGGDEFAVVLTEWPGVDGLNSIIDRIRVEMAGGFEIGGETVESKASLGSAIYPKHAASGTELMRQADIALYAAKAAGRGVHCVYTRTMGEELALRHRTLSAIRGAIADREIVPFYQPIVRASDLQPVGMEALVRWNRSAGQAVPPALFMAAFADPPLATAIGEIMITAVAGQINAWREDGIAVPPVSVNVSPDQMAWPDFAPALLNLLAAYQVPPSLLAVEITEDVILSQDRHALVATMERLSNAGIRIDFDDFGTGYASLTHLKEYPVDRIKLDRSFISQLPHDRESLGIVRAVISLAHELAKEVVAEGVETREQAALLTGMGCDMMQGYLFSVPLAADEAGDYLASHVGLQFTAEATPLRRPGPRALARPA